MHSIQNIVGIWRVRGGNIKEEIIMTRLRIGHSNLKNTLHITGKRPTGFSGQCQVPETVEYVLVRCRNM